jgi:uncharacterized membrane protein
MTMAHSAKANLTRTPARSAHRGRPVTRMTAGTKAAAAAANGRAPLWAQVASLGLALAAVGIGSYLTATHYADPAALACPDTGIVNCTLVTTSSWSVIAGVPLAVLGLVWALVMTVLTVPWAWRSRVAWVDTLRLVLAAGGAAMVLYLIYVELFQIGAICLWCTAMHVTAVCLFGVILAARAARAAWAPEAVGAGGRDFGPAGSGPSPL